MFCVFTSSCPQPNGQFFARGGGVVKHLPKHFPAQVVQISTKQSKRNEGRMMR